MLASSAIRPPPLRARLLFTFLALAFAPALPRARAQTTPFHYTWAGLVHDSFTLDGSQYWTAEDGGRIRHRASSTSAWVFQPTPVAVQDQLRRIFFLDDALTGWAVGDTGWVLHTANGGATWSTLGTQIVSPLWPAASTHQFENLYDVRFFDPNLGWLLGEHAIWTTTNGGVSWSLCPLVMQDNHVLSYSSPSDQLILKKMELYKLDLVDRGAAGTPSPFGMACGEPGLVFRTLDGVTWKVVFDLRCLCPSCSPLICYDCSTAHLPPILTPYGGLEPCATGTATSDGMCDPDQLLQFDAWDIELSRNPDSKLAVMVGGVGTTCGLAFSSTDDGVHWTKEVHECQCVYSGSPPPGCIAGGCAGVSGYGYSPSTPVFKNSSFPTLYGVGLFGDDGVAITAGYGGLAARRDPSTGVWQDKSAIADKNHITDPATASAVNLPQSGATTDGTDGLSGRGLIVGFGGTIRETTDGGRTWTDAADVSQPNQMVPHSSPWRIRDIIFQDETVGWQVGQFGRIGKTNDGGRTFVPTSAPDFSTNGPLLSAIAFDPTFTRGVVVSFTDPPHIYWSTSASGGTIWTEANFAPVQGHTLSQLSAVCWAGTSNFWAVGNGGSVLRSRDNGVSWRQILPVGTGDGAFTIMGVAFLDLFNGILVGSGPDSTGMLRSAAYAFHDTGAGVTWTAITPADTSITLLKRVAIAGSAAYAVGDAVRNVEGVPTRVGVALKSTFAGGGFGAFAEVPAPTSPGFRPCSDDLDPTQQVMTDVAADPSGNVWVGAQCGRVWRLTPPGTTWTNFQSQTGTHILGISFAPATSGGGFVGYFGGTYNGGPKKPSHSIVKYKP